MFQSSGIIYVAFKTSDRFFKRYKKMNDESLGIKSYSDYLPLLLFHFHRYTYKVLYFLTYNKFMNREAQ
jgi:hypothetical protein